jgi:hypothetical protein
MVPICKRSLLSRNLFLFFTHRRCARNGTYDLHVTYLNNIYKKCFCDYGSNRGIKKDRGMLKYEYWSQVVGKNKEFLFVCYHYPNEPTEQEAKNVAK